MAFIDKKVRRAERAAFLKQRFEELHAVINRNFYELGKILAEIREWRYFEEWGFSTFTEYAASVDLRPSRAYYLVNVAKLVDMFPEPERDRVKNIGMGQLRILSRTQGLTPKEAVERVKEVVNNPIPLRKLSKALSPSVPYSFSIPTASVGRVEKALRAAKAGTTRTNSEALLAIIEAYLESIN